jgi:hypothetical protein
MSTESLASRFASARQIGRNSAISTAATDGASLVTAITVVRRAHRTVVARILAVCLLALAASPMTAPFSVLDAFDNLSQSHPVDAHHPAHDMAEGRVRVAPHLVVTAPDLTPALVVVRHDRQLAAVRPVLLATAPLALSSVLRL